MLYQVRVWRVPPTMVTSLFVGCLSKVGEVSLSVFYLGETNKDYYLKLSLQLYYQFPDYCKSGVGAFLVYNC